MTIPTRMTRPGQLSQPLAPGRQPPLPAFGQVGTEAIASTRASQPAALRAPDTTLILTALAMLVLGLLMVQSASQFADPIDPGALARREALWAALGGVAMLVTACVDYHYWRRLATPGIICALILLALVLPFGVDAGGAQRWLAIGSFLTFQPSELAKLAFTLFAADQLTQNQGAWNIRRIAPVAVVTALSVGIVLLQNDLGTAVILAICGLVLLLLVGMPLAPLAVTALTASALGASIIAATPFRRARVLAFLHPLDCNAAASYHICQSLIALGSGGPLGKGLGDSLQKTGYLPAPYTDSIFAVIGEELGFWGSLLVVGLCVILLWRGLRIARRAPDAFGALLAGGVTCWLVTQAIINIGSSVAALPFTGVPLPFISFGGSSLIVSLAAIGMLLNISAQAPQRKQRLGR